MFQILVLLLSKFIHNNFAVKNNNNYLYNLNSQIIIGETPKFQKITKRPITLFNFYKIK